MPVKLKQKGIVNSTLSSKKPAHLDLIKVQKQKKCYYIESVLGN